ncbi:phage tail protein [uncultured Actinobacillus sp.]|uniref:TipJ family phage tail tip protein n=1 Tax=uncultured Actinobacillus sp. TaxID=417616 RepID=UPI0025DF18F6|nr:phage tail protein [uncultured Actinobacillus sp.]
MGGKKQGSARTPHEAPDSLKSAQRLRAIGLISLGPIKGTANKWKSTFFDNTPIQNENGVDDNDEASFNFKNTEVSFTLGTQDQAPLQGFEMSEREVSVSTEVKYTTPITRTVTDPDVTRLRVTLGVNALYEQNEQGDTNGTSVWFRILINGLPRATYEINGKSSSRFYRSYIIDDLPERPFTITVERTTTDSKSQRLQNATNWVSYTEIIDTKLSYPNMALVGIKTDSRYNPNFPNVNFLLYGRLVKVPSTYDPETRTYSTALWKGDWKQAWTNNPAWVFYDLVTNPLAGLGKRVGDYGLDKFQLYQIAKYCDELVDDGYGGKEPRMTANLWLTDQRSAYEVLSDMASVFRAIAVWNGTQFTAIQDRTADPVCTYSQANVIDGKFSRQYAAMKSIYTAAEVEYADERNMYQKAVEYVADDLMIDRYGYNVKKMTAYATTSRGQAHRWGKWVLATSLLEQCTITFSVGRQGLLHLPGDIIEVADNDYAGKTLGGRVVAVNGKVVTLDQPIEISGNSYLSYLNDEMKVVKVAISSVDSKNKAVVTLATAPTGLEPMDDWVLKTPSISTQLYRAIGITENDDGSYTITALQHEPQKEAIVDGSASFIPVATTAHTGGAQKVANAEASINENGVKLTWEMPSSNSIVKYEVRLYRNGVLYQTYLDLETTELTFDDLPDGSYVAEIRSKNANGQLSDPVTRAFEINLTINRLATKSLYFSIQLDWDLPKTATVGNYTEIWRSVDNNISNAKKIATLPYPQNSYILNGIDLNESYYFFVRCGDKSGNKGQFTDGVFGEADHNPDTLLNVLEGQITRSQLGADLIASLQQDIDTAVASEAGVRQSAVDNVASRILAESQARIAALKSETDNRTKAIKAENANLTKKIQDEASARGTAINQLQNVDAQQAQQITTLTAKADNVLSGITAEQKARADGDKANADKITALTSRVGNAEANLSNIQSTKANKTEVASIAQTALQAVWKADAKTAVDNLQVGGRNLFTGTSKVHTVNSIANYNNAILGITSNIDWATVKALTISCTVQCTGAIGRTTNDGTPRYGANCLIVYTDGSNQWLETWVEPSVGVSTTLNQRVSNTFIIPQGKVIDHIEHHKMQIRAHESGYVSISQAKLEAGTIATDWTPAPEDVDQAVANVSASLTSYKATQANVDKAQTDQITAHTARLGTAESKISAAERSISTLSSSMATKFSEVAANFTKAKTDLTARIATEEQARADGDKANADKITAITARVGTAESTIANLQSTKASKTEVSSIAQQTVTAAMGDTKAQVSALSNAVTDANNKLKATHTIKAQTIAGGRTAIAGIAMGATSDGITTESSVIVMADKFGIVANANDRNVKPVFSVANGQVGIRGDLVVAGSVTRDKHSDGSGANLLYNPIFANDGNGWIYYVDTANIETNGFSFNNATGTYQSGAYLPTENQFRLQRARKSTTGDARLGGLYQDMKLKPNTYYCFSAYVGGHRSYVDLNIEHSGISVIRKSWTGRGRNGGYPNNTIETGLESYYRIWLLFKTNADNSAEANYRLIINTWGQNGQDNPFLIIRRPMLEECTEHTTEPSPWANAGVTQVHGGSIIANTIRGEHIQANQTLSSPNITGGTITGNTINGTTIKGSNISGTNISGGTVTGATVKGGRIEGGVISGSTILGDIVKAVILTKNGNGFEGTVPASEVSSRTVVIPSFSFKAGAQETSTIAIYIDGVKVSESSVSGTHKQVFAQGTTPATTVRGTVRVSVSGTASGSVSGRVSGTVSGNVGGSVNGGYVSGSASGTVSGNVGGTASGSISGSASGQAEGSIPATLVTTTFWLDIPAFGSISGYKQITGKSVVIKVTANNATALSGQDSLVALVA